MATVHITKGHDLKLKGAPEKVLKTISCPDKIRVIPDDFPGVKPKLTIKVDDHVKIGDQLFFDKNNPSVNFCSHVSGKILEIKLGERRKVEYIEISCDNNDYCYDKSSISSDSYTREEIIDLLLDGSSFDHFVPLPRLHNKALVKEDK